jgi:hypothetical protein
MSQVSKFRIVTYNVHKCVGVDWRLDPARIVSVLKEINADIVALQEVLCVHGRSGEDDQAHFIARGLGFNYCMGHNRELKGGVYGNLALSRFPLLGSENHDISVAGREERGCLRVDIDLGKESRLHVYNVRLLPRHIHCRELSRGGNRYEHQQRKPPKRSGANRSRSYFSPGSERVAQRQYGEIVAAGDEVTILITAHPHNDRARNRRQTPSR